MDTPRIKTQRLLLRPMLESDFEAYCHYAMDPEVMQYIRPIGTKAEVKEAFAGFQKAWLGEEGQWMALAVELIDTGDLIGDVGFRYHSKVHEQIELGYKFHKDFHGKGYGSEAMDALIAHIASHWPFHKLVAYCDPRNTASYKLMQRYGMQQEGWLKEHYKMGDEWQDELVYGVLKSDLKLV
ncbi:GNAT family N-acetyltransferase [Kangiella sp. TOML190]|uniref:GNAT family N-acetyltransferase n=1 Tax=Kangiella sp. TOML190 TaxID=2931351 RepID=UPI00203D24AD|nr:GNAT family protein [Kangiella sp. TOML190]